MWPWWCNISVFILVVTDTFLSSHPDAVEPLRLTDLAEVQVLNLAGEGG